MTIEPYKQNGHLKTYKMKLTTLSPVFIGSGEKLSGLDYFYDDKNERLNIIDESKFSKFLNNYKLTDEFVSYVANDKNAKLFKWAKAYKIELAEHDIYKKSYKYSKNDLSVLNNVSLICRDMNGFSYIPGSSLKGAIRTAILYKKIHDNTDIVKKYRKQIAEELKAGNKRELKKFAKNIEKELLSIKSPDPEKKLTAELLDVFRGIQISDSQTIEEKDFNLYKKCDYTIHSKEPHYIPLYRECINSYVDTFFSITLDTKITAQLGIDIDYITKALEEYTENWHELMKVYEKDNDKFNLFMPNEDKDYDANFCLGGGAGFLTKTVVYSILDKETAIDSVREYLDKAFTNYDKQTHQRVPAHNHVAKDKEISPRTLNLVKDNGYYVNIGWCNISVVKE